MEQGRKNVPQRAVKVASVDVDVFFYPKIVSAIHIMTLVLYAFLLNDIIGVFTGWVLKRRC